jgi:hypothetical protein
LAVGLSSHVKRMVIRQSASMTSAQKKEMKSLKAPMGGTPGWLFRTAAKAKSKAARKENIPSSILRPRKKILRVINMTAMVTPHIKTMTKTEKKITVEERVIFISMPT